MQWTDLVGHQQQRDWFSSALSRGRLASSFLFVGPEGVGKRTFARLLAKSLLCRATSARQLDFCGGCEDCVQVDAHTHPDLIEIAKPPESSALSIDQLVGREDARMREGLCYEIHLRPFYGRCRVAIVDDADFVSRDGANSILKSLEEPPPGAVVILISNSLQRQLPTIRSRCQAVWFRGLSDQQLAQLLVGQGMVSDPAEAQLLGEQAAGSLALAQRLQDSELAEIRASLMAQLAQRPLPLKKLAAELEAAINAAGKEGAIKRERFKLLLGFAAALYRQLTLLQLAGDQVDPAAWRAPSDSQLSAAVARTLGGWTRGASAALACWQACVRATEEVDRNVNQAALIQSWLAELATLSGA